MSPDPFRNQIDDRTEYDDVSEQFYEERLDRENLAKADWPSQIDRAAMDLLFGVAIGRSKDTFDHGGTIGTIDFGRATGGYYVEGLIELVGDRSDLPSLIQAHKEADIGDFVLALAKLRHELNEADEGDINNVDRAIEAIVEKLATRGLGPKSGRQPLHNPEAVVDIVHQLFSDPSASEYAEQLLEALDEVRRPGSDIDLLEYLDRPQMVTPLWDHQQNALENWCTADYAGYVNMATATGKTVLGLGAIAHLFGQLHPRDEAALPSRNQSGSNVQVLIVAGQDLLLEQWQSEFDEHLNIPRDRTKPGDDREIDLSWGTIEFRTAQDLLSSDHLKQYDLVILDEAHRYRSGGRDGRSWRDLFDDLTERSDAIIAMSGSIDQDWIGDDAARDALEANLAECATFTIPEAREANVIADFSWEIMYAASAETETLEGVAESTQPLAAVYDRTHHKFQSSDLEEVSGSIPDTFETLRDLRSFAQSNEGSNARERSEAFDQLATAAFSRRPRRWQLSPPDDTVRELVERHINESKCIVLVQSYEQAEQIGETLRSRIGDDVIVVSSDGATAQSEQIDRFKETDGGVIVGPGDVIGVGVDIPAADVAINLSKGGVNASLVQRIGRVLRNPSGDNRATFYQVVTLPTSPDARLAGEDGRRLLRRASEFRALGSRFRELPGFATADDHTSPILAELEIAGSKAMEADHRSVEEIVEDDVAQEWLYELLEAIDGRSTRTDPVLPVTWRGETVDPQTEPIRTAIESRERSRKNDAENANNEQESTTQQLSVCVADDGNDTPITNAQVSISAGDIQRTAETSEEGVATFTIPTHLRQVTASIKADDYEDTEAVSLLHGRSGPYTIETSLSKETETAESSTTDDSDATETEENGVQAQDDETTEAGTIDPSELTELYDVFLGLRQTLDVLIEAAGVEASPTVEWRETIATFLDSGLEDWEAGYGTQQADRSGITAADYREAFGDGLRVTDFQAIETAAPSPLVAGLQRNLSERPLDDIPVAPESGTPLPIIIESRTHLEDARQLLVEFPESPPVGNPPEELTKADLTTVSGVTETDASVLAENGFETVADLREASYEEIREIPEIPDHLALRIKADVE